MDHKISREFRFWELLRFASPSMLMMMFLSTYTIVDGFFVSRFVGTDALSAVNITYPVTSIFVAIGVMFATGGSAVVASKMGEKRYDEANSNFALIAIVCVGVAIVIASLCLMFLKPLVILMGAEGRLINLCEDYLRIILIATPISVLQMVFQNFFVTASRPMLGLGLTILAGLTNIVLDYLFIVIFDFGIAGAGYATAIGSLIPSIGGLVFFVNNKKGLHFKKVWWSYNVIFKSCTNGSSEMVTNISTSVTTFIFNILMMKFAGADGVAAISVILYCQFLMIALFLGFSIGVAPVISYHYGAENHLYMHKLKKMCWLFVIVSSICVFVFSISSSEIIAAIFSPKSSGVYPLIVTGMRLFSFSFLFSGIGIFASSMFTAISDGKTSAIISFSRTFIFIILGIIILTKFFGINGLWLAIPFAELVTSILVLFIMYRHYKEPNVL